MAKRTPSAATILARTAGGPHFVASFQTHMMQGDQVPGAGAHSGLHSLNTAAAQYPTLVQTLVAADARVPLIHASDVNLRPGKAPKRSSFFPATMNWAAIHAAVTEAWRDNKIYSPDSVVYAELAAAYNLSWVGLAAINGYKVWIGSTRPGTANNPIETAFPAVNHKFF